MASFSPASEPASSLKTPPDGSNVVKAEATSAIEQLPTDSAKRFFELEAVNNRLNEEIQSLLARNLVLEEKNREQRRLMDDKEEMIIRLQEEAMSLSVIQERLNKKYDRLNDKFKKVREDYESSERQWIIEKKTIEGEKWNLSLEKSKLEIELSDVRRGMNGNGELLEKVKAVEELKKVLEEKEAVISKLETKIKVLEREKNKVKEEFRDRLFKTEELVRKWLLKSAGTRNREINDFLGSGQKSAVQLKELDIKKDVSHAHNVLNSQIVLISDDAEETEAEEKTSAVAAVPALKKRKPEEDVTCSTEKISSAVAVVPAINSPESFAVLQKRKPEEDVTCSTEKRSSSATAVPDLKSPENIAVFQKRKPGEDVTCFTEKRSSTAAAVPALKSPENLEALQKRKSEEDVTFSTEKEAETKRCKYGGDPKEGKLWQTAEKMFLAFTTTNKELCMKSVCALYRKHKSLGVWKNQSDGNRTFIPICERRGVELGNFLTAGDPEGRLKKSVAETERQNSSFLNDCRDICRHHFKELFRIYNNDLDPLYLP